MPVNYEIYKFEPAKRKRSGKYKICPECGRRFYIRPSRDRTFCSQKCYWNSRRTMKVCAECGKEFTIPKSSANRYTVCSIECRTAHTKYVRCKRCRRIFRAEKRLNRHYCSEECRRPPLVKQCANCGKGFRSSPSLNRRFCSQLCFIQFGGETSIEKKVREALDQIGIKYTQEAQIGRYFADFALPAQKVILEADGDYWHQNPAKEKKRDRYLLRKGWNVIHFSETEINSVDNLAVLIRNRLEKIAWMNPPGG